ncbi:MAG: hypothetical protein AB1716_20860, partial [Planctomycetota bacterium]
MTRRKRGLCALVVCGVVAGAATRADGSAAPRAGQEPDVVVAVAGAPGGAPDAGDMLVAAGGVVDALECPPTSLCGQNCGGNTWFYADAQFCSGGNCGRVRAEKYPPPGVTINRPIGGVLWEGLYVAPGLEGCEKPKHLFWVRFYRDNGQNMPDPNHPVYNERLEVQARATDRYFILPGGPAPIWEFTAVLSGPVTLLSGWLSVQGDSDPPLECYHLWAPSNEGDGLIVQWWERPFGGFQYATLTADLNYCLLEAKAGACCNDCTSQCANDVMELVCLQGGGRFVQNTLCANINPPCGDATGACCRDDGTCVIKKCRECRWSCKGDCNCDGLVDFRDIKCFVGILSGTVPPHCPPENMDMNHDGRVDFNDINPFVACLAGGGGSCASSPNGPCEPPGGLDEQGNVWLGAGTQCTECCTVVIPTGAARENEPDCGPNYVDTFNGGCNSTPPVFSNIACGQTIYGESGTFTGGLGRDTDWYKFTIAANSTLMIDVLAEFDVVIWIAHGGACDPNTGYWQLDHAVLAGQCEPAVFSSRCMRPGEYWAVVMPTELTGVPCGADYSLKLTCTSGCEPCTVDCPAGAEQENEVCGQSTNGGCDSTPNVFEPIQVDTEYCGTLWARNGNRDTDWFTFTVNTSSLIELYWEAEFPAFAGMVTCQETGTFGAQCGCRVWGAYIGPCAPTRITGYDLPGGTYWVVPLSAEEATGGIFYGYPCETENVYVFRVDAQEINCPDLVICETGAFGAPEGEPECGPDYLDTHNGGCDAALPRFQTLNCAPPMGGICAKSGTFTRSDPNDPRGLDSDWYEFALTQNTRFTLQIWPEFPLSFRIIRGPTCPGTVIESYEFFACTQAPDMITRCFPPGTYWFRFAPTDANVRLECTLNYAFLLTCETPCTPCVVTCP